MATIIIKKTLERYDKRVDSKIPYDNAHHHIDISYNYFNIDNIKKHILDSIKKLSEYEILTLSATNIPGNSIQFKKGVNYFYSYIIVSVFLNSVYNNILIEHVAETSGQSIDNPLFLDNFKGPGSPGI